jgi:carboxyl-terminal processing protease
MSKAIKVMLGAMIGLALALALFGGGVAVGALVPRFQEMGPRLFPAFLWPSSDGPVATAQPSSTEELFSPFWQAWDLVHTRFVDQPVDDTALMRGSIIGMLEALGDEHTSYMDPDQYLQANTELSGEYEGIGAWVDTGGEYLTIVSPMPGSPAEKAGLKAGDVVIGIDGDDMTGTDPSLVVRRILGPKGTAVRLTLKREGTTEPIEVSVVRESILVPSVESKMLEGDIAYVRLLTFGDETTSDLRAVLKTLMAETPRGLILDLRGNGGGYLNTAVDVTSEFLQEGVVLTERFGDGEEEVYRARSGGLATEIPMVVLIDAGSASASEIVAGALQDHERAILVGETTYGKGSVQDWVTLDGDGGAVRVTVARWYTPNDRQINEEGLKPDLEVLISEEDVAAGRDPQLDRALEALQARLDA